MSVKFKFDENAIRKVAMDAAKEKAKTMVFDIECPHCHAKIKAKSGQHPCPKCGETINLTLEFGFD